MLRTIALITLLVVSSGAYAETGVSITIYNQNLALVRDVRLLDYRPGRQELMFRDVSGQIDATSVHYGASGISMLEQNFDYDLVSPDKLLEKYIDKQIEVVDKDGNMAKGTLLSYGSGTAGGQIVLQQSDGSIRSILTTNAADVRYPSLPEGLITKPTLRWLVDAPSAGSKETEVAYLTGGLSWRADYVMLLNEANNHADLDAWVTINNSCGASFKDAKLKLIAGEPNRVREQMQYMAMDGMAMESRAPKAAPQFEEKSFFEYHLYTMQRPATVLNNQTKQLSLFPSADFAVKKIYEYDPQRDNDRVSVSVKFDNKKENGLGIAIPAGLVRVYQQGDDGSQEFIGEDRVEHTPRNEEMRVTVGKAFDIVVERTQKDYRQISNRVTEMDMEVKLRNRKTEAVDVTVFDHYWGDWEIIRSSLTAKKSSANKVEFSVPVGADQETILTYTVRIQ